MVCYQMVQDFTLHLWQRRPRLFIGQFRGKLVSFAGWCICQQPAALRGCSDHSFPRFLPRPYALSTEMVLSPLWCSFSTAPIKTSSFPFGPPIFSIVLHKLLQFQGLLTNLAKAGREIGSNVMFHSQQSFFFLILKTLLWKCFYF